MSNYLDTYILAEEWRDILRDIEEDPELAEEYEYDIKEYVGLCEELNVDPSPTGLENADANPLVAEDDFEEYAEQLAEDIGAISSDAGWPLSYIDWSAAADALRIDYTTVTYRGEDYLARLG